MPAQLGLRAEVAAASQAELEDRAVTIESSPGARAENVKELARSLAHVETAVATGFVEVVEVAEMRTARHSQS